MHIYSSMFYDSRITNLANIQWEKQKGLIVDGKKARRVQCVAKVTQMLWDSESPEIKQQVQKEHDCRYDEALNEYESAKQKSSAPTQMQS
jgi:hypothetical protein